MRKSPLFFNYKICTKQLPKFLLPTFLFKEKYGQRKVGYFAMKRVTMIPTAIIASVPIITVSTLSSEPYCF